MILENGDPPIECKSEICSWKLGRDQKMQLKYDTIEKHYGKAYVKIVDEDGTVRKKQIIKDETKCFHKKYEIEYNKMMEEKKIEDQIGGTITMQYRKVKENTLATKCLQFAIVFYLLKQGRPITDFYDHKTLFELAGVQHLPCTHCSDKSGWEIAKCLALVEKEDLVESVKKSRFISLSIDEVTVVDSTSWVCIHVYTFIEHCRKPHLLTVHRMKEACNSENLYNLVVTSLKEIANLTDEEIAR